MSPDPDQEVDSLALQADGKILAGGFFNTLGGQPRNYLGRNGAWDKDKEEALQRECTEQVTHAVDDYLAVPPPGPDAMFDFLYATLPAALEEQRDAARRFAPRGGEPVG